MAHYTLAKNPVREAHEMEVLHIFKLDYEKDKQIERYSRQLYEADAFFLCCICDSGLFCQQRAMETEQIKGLETKLFIL